MKKNISLSEQIEMVDQKIERLTTSMSSQISIQIGNLAEIIKISFDITERRLADLELGQDAILLKLDNYAYKFEVIDLKQRVSRLEKKTGT